MRKLNLLRRFAADRRGNIGMIAALGMPLLIAGAAFGTEASYWMNQKTSLSFATDAAAVTVVNQYQRKSTEEVILAAARQSLKEHGYDIATLELNIDLPAANSADETIAVSTRIPGEKYFSKLLFDKNVYISSLTSIKLATGNVCMLALKTSGTGIQMKGNGNVNLNSCIAAANSTSTSAIDFQGSATMRAGCLYTSGNVTGQSGKLTAECSKLKTRQPAVDNPLRNHTRPALPASCTNSVSVKSNQPGAVTPGCYRSMDIKGTANFAPGVYYINGGTSGQTRTRTSPARVSPSFFTVTGAST